MGQHQECHLCRRRIPSNQKKNRLGQPALWETYRRFTSDTCDDDEKDKHVCLRCFSKIKSISKDDTGKWKRGGQKRSPLTQSPLRTRTKRRREDEDIEEPEGERFENRGQVEDEGAQANSEDFEDIENRGQEEDARAQSEDFVGFEDGGQVEEVEVTTNAENFESSENMDEDESNTEGVEVNSESQNQINIPSQDTFGTSQAQSQISVASVSSTSSVLRRRLPEIKSVASTQKCCFICRRKSGRSRIPKEALCEVWRLKSILVPHNNRCCTNHLHDKKFTPEAMEDINADKDGVLLSDSELSKWIMELTRSGNSQKSSHYNFDKADTLKDDEWTLLTGFGKETFDALAEKVSGSVHNSTNRTVRNALAMFLMLLRLNLTQNVLAHLFGISNQSVISETIASVSQALTKNFVGQYIGMKHLSREDALRDHSRDLYYTVYGETDRTKLFLVLDGTYVYVEKPLDFELQRMTFSMQKMRNLVKPFMIVLPSGRILWAAGPYYANGKNNDSGILRTLMEMMDGSEEFFRPGDHLILDRGFRDVIPYLESKGLICHMPELLDRKAKQFTTEKGNKSRIVTLGRWVVEAANGRIKKKFKFFRDVVAGGYLEKIGAFFNISCALINAFCRPLTQNSARNDAISIKTLELKDTTNILMKRVEDEKMDRKTKSWKKASDNDCPDFPMLTVEDLEAITLGVYQVNLAKRYTNMHLDDNSDYRILLNEDFPGILRAKIESRFSNNKKHELWIQYDKNKTGLDAIVGYYCRCRQGARTVGTCSHITSVLWFMAYRRHQAPMPVKKRKRRLDILDAGSITLTLGRRNEVTVDDDAVPGPSNIADSQASRHSWSQTTLATSQEDGDDLSLFSEEEGVLPLYSEEEDLLPLHSDEEDLLRLYSDEEDLLPL